MTLSSEETLNLALYVPHSGNVVIRTRQQVVALVAPLNGLNEMIFICPLRYFIIALRNTYVPQLN